ncbi:MAG: SIS domain-containing protein, partial [Solirubrobacteraceae bacterium]
MASSTSGHTQTFLGETARIAGELPIDAIDAMADGLAAVRARGGRLFIIGVGGGAGHASHAVNDFRKLCHIECYAPTDNVSELTARTNDEGWDTSFSAWLRISRLRDSDALLVFSVGGGSREQNISMNIVNAVELAAERGADVFGVVGRS